MGRNTESLYLNLILFYLCDSKKQNNYGKIFSCTTQGETYAQNMDEPPEEHGAQPQRQPQSQRHGLVAGSGKHIWNLNLNK